METEERTSLWQRNFFANWGTTLGQSQWLMVSGIVFALYVLLGRLDFGFIAERFIADLLLIASLGFATGFGWLSLNETIGHERYLFLFIAVLLLYHVTGNGLFSFSFNVGL